MEKKKTVTPHSNSLATVIGASLRIQRDYMNMYLQDRPVVIDAWAQHPTLRHINDPIFDSLKRWTKMDYLNEELPVELTIRQMDEAGVSKSLISAWEAPGKSMISNDEVASVVDSAPDRFVGIGSVDISHPMKAVREMHRCVKALGFKGIRVLPWLWSKPPTDRWFYPVYTACCELGIPFCTQIGHTGPLMPSEVGRPIYLDQVALDFPELKIVAGHIGYPWTEEAIAVATKHEHVYIDTSAYTAKRYPPELVRYMKSYGAHKVLFGTNYPMISAKKALQEFDTLALDEKTERLFLAENAIRVFELEG
ncbi:amidohydrolase family protein [Microbulbifer spongiae]|uniref:Amidohydrolase family protein n=1 Tax=Microbulbifer spongiae TaxID=2944933 RepID=A0ABY9E8J9_9GAMM|nr:amidohydrolase family protein [Microbulbifer sp. MI-G]WKD49002.1 amidohydrolase family protein [Microbulbifer sp. MI-G]